MVIFKMLKCCGILVHNSHSFNKTFHISEQTRIQQGFVFFLFTLLAALQMLHIEPAEKEEYFCMRTFFLMKLQNNIKLAREAGTFSCSS